MKTTMTLPGARQELDLRVCVTLELDELPWPIRFYFLRTDGGRWENVAFEMGLGPVSRSAFVEEQLEIDDRALLTGTAPYWVLENFRHYQAIAESRLNTERVLPKPGGAVTPEAVAYVARRYHELGGQRGAVNYLAQELGVSRTTIWRRLSKAGVERS